MVNGRLIYTICRKLFYTICHLCIKNLHYHRRQAWTRLNNHLRGPYEYNGYPIFTHRPIGILTNVKTTFRVSRATYHQNCRYNDSNYELSSVQMLKHTQTTRNIFRSKQHTNRSDLTPQFHLLDPTMVYKHRDCYLQ